MHGTLLGILGMGMGIAGYGHGDGQLAWDFVDLYCFLSLNDFIRYFQ